MIKRAGFLTCAIVLILLAAIAPRAQQAPAADDLKKDASRASGWIADTDATNGGRNFQL